MGHIHTRAVAVIRLIDAATERAVRYRDVQIRTIQQHKVIWKDTDCAVILEQGGVRAGDSCHIDVLISGKLYQETQLHVDLTTDPAPAVCSVWLHPSEKYPFQEDMTVIQGVCDVTDALYVLWLAGDNRYKLADTTAVGDGCISVWGIDGAADGRSLLLWEDSQKELVTLAGQAHHGAHAYRVREAVQHVFHRGKAEIYKALPVSMDCGGNFFAVLRGNPRTDGKVLFWSGGAETGLVDIAFSVVHSP